MSEPISTMSLNNQYSNLSESDKHRFSDIAVKLLDRMVLLEMRDSDKQEYYFVREHYTLFKNYFGLINYEVNYYEGLRLIMLETSVTRTKLSLKKNETVVLLCLRLLHIDKLKKDVSTSFRTFISLEELHDTIDKTGILTTKRLLKTELESILRLFKRFSLLNFETPDFKNDQMILELYPTLVRILPIEEIEPLLNRIKGMAKEDDSNEETDED